jgi:predicted secreted protein
MKFPETTLLVGLMMLVAALAACSSPTLAPVAGSVQLTQKDSGKQVTVSPGGTLEIALDQNASTGYSWQLLSVNDGILRLLSNTPTGGSPLPGAPSKETFKFQAVGSGLSTVVRIGYKQWWNAQVEPETVFEVIVVVPGTPVLPTPRPTQAGAPKPLETLTRLTLKDSGKEIAVPRGSPFQIDFDLDGKAPGAWEIIANNNLGIQLVSIGIVYPGGTPAVTVPRQTFTFQAVAATNYPLRLGFKDWANETAQPNPIFEVFVVAR